jgi:hypothetical protein
MPTRGELAPVKHQLRAWRYFLLDRVLLRHTGIYVNCTQCFDCGSDEDWYMLTDATWAATGMGKRGHLCIACVEDRLGRLVTREDFTDAPINDLHEAGRRSERLIDRLLDGQCWSCGAWVPRGHMACVVCGRW